MKKLLLLILLIPMIIKAQTKDTSFTQVDERLNKASIEMIKFDKQFKTGIILEISGGIILGAGSLGTIKNNQPILIAGGLIAFIGFVMNSSSSTHVRNAGIYLRGNNIVVPLRRK